MHIIKLCKVCKSSEMIKEAYCAYLDQRSIYESLFSNDIQLILYISFNSYIFAARQHSFNKNFIARSCLKGCIVDVGEQMIKSKRKRDLNRKNCFHGKFVFFLKKLST